MDEKKCPGCGAVLVRRPKERPRDFLRRKFCSLRCSGRFHGRQHAGHDVVTAAVTQAASTDPQERRAALEILSEIANDTTQDIYLRVSAAKALLPYEERKPGTTGKKQQKATAAKDVMESGRFAPMPYPRLIKG